MRVIDLYAGIGGWALGFKLAGFEIAQSYEWWEPAARTHRANSNSAVTVIDIRKLDLNSLPQNIDIVIGSPPCTQFSYSNRGGSGNVKDGLVDIVKFLEVVQHIKPVAWAFENVPRVKSVIERELECGGSLEKYRDLFEDAEIDIFDMSEFGLPQRRKRCIAGNFNFELLRSYSETAEHLTLGHVVESLAEKREPIFSGISLPTVLDNEHEDSLNWEEERFNRDMKTAHPIYNGMPFPDPLDRSSRTVTATCTRVSRESLIVPAGKAGQYRRLSVRERASLQGFPVNFQFLGKSHAEKLKMVGNAIPPIFSYLVGEAINGTTKDKLLRPSQIDANKKLHGIEFIPTKPDKAGKSYPANRRFRFSIPNLRFKSGMRFELSNVDGPERWSVGFYYGDSKRIKRHDFQTCDIVSASASCSGELREQLQAMLSRLEVEVNLKDLDKLQAAWSHKANGLHPFKLIDDIGKIALDELETGTWSTFDKIELEKFVFSLAFPTPDSERLAIQKFKRYLEEIAIGSVIAAFINDKLSATQKLLLQTA